ncbi:MAG: hypothetical protein C0602_12050 [Denitrovibrio sp.]|nr:MAG: hypothetical protein C0602_12050 [Denitrovibrio sp.]
MVKKNSVTDIFEHLSEDEISRIMLLKSGLEDLNLILQEIEDTYEQLGDISISDRERKHHKLRLLTLEKYLAELNNKVNNAMGTEDEKEKLS